MRLPYLMSWQACTETRSPSFTRRLLRATLLRRTLPSSTDSSERTMKQESRRFLPLTMVESPRKRPSSSIFAGEMQMTELSSVVASSTKRRLGDFFWRRMAVAASLSSAASGLGGLPAEGLEGVGSDMTRVGQLWWLSKKMARKKAQGGGCVVQPRGVAALCCTAAPALSQRSAPQTRRRMRSNPITAQPWLERVHVEAETIKSQDRRSNKFSLSHGVLWTSGKWRSILPVVEIVHGKARTVLASRRRGAVGSRVPASLAASACLFLPTA